MIEQLTELQKMQALKMGLSPGEYAANLHVRRPLAQIEVPEGITVGQINQALKMGLTPIEYMRGQKEND